MQKKEGRRKIVLGEQGKGGGLHKVGRNSTGSNGNESSKEVISLTQKKQKKKENEIKNRII